MTQSDTVKIVGGIVVGVVAAGAVIAGLFELRPFNDIDSGIDSVSEQGDTCIVSGKETEVRAHRKSRLVWKIRNYCTDGKKESLSATSVTTKRVAQTTVQNRDRKVRPNTRLRRTVRPLEP